MPTLLNSLKEALLLRARWVLESYNKVIFGFGGLSPIPKNSNSVFYRDSLSHNFAHAITCKNEFTRANGKPRRITVEEYSFFLRNVHKCFSV